MNIKRLLPALLLLLWLPVLADEPLHLTLTDALRMALQNSPVLAQYRSRVAQNQYQVQEILSAGNPTFSINPTFTRTEPPLVATFGQTQIVEAQENNYNVAFTLNQTLATFGRLHWHAQAQKLAVKEAEEDYRQQVNDLIDTVTSDYMTALLQEENVRIAQERVNTEETNLKDTQSLLRAGVVAHFDELQTETAVADARTQLLVANNTRDQAVAALLSALGQPTSRAVTLAPISEPAAPNNARDAGLAQALKQRPEIESLDFAVASAQDLVYWLASNLNPFLTFQSQYHFDNGIGLAPINNEWNTTLNLNVPVLDGGLTKAQVGEAKETVHQLQDTLANQQRTVELEVQSAWLDVQSNWQRVAVARKQVESATEAARVSEVRYQAGVGTNLERLQATLDLTTARVALATARYQYEIAQSHWRRVIAAAFPVQLPGITDLAPKEGPSK